MSGGFESWQGHRGRDPHQIWPAGVWQSSVVRIMWCRPAVKSTVSPRDLIRSRHSTDPCSGVRSRMRTGPSLGCRHSTCAPAAGTPGTCTSGTWPWRARIQPPVRILLERHQGVGAVACRGRGWRGHFADQLLGEPDPGIEPCSALAVPCRLERLVGGPGVRQPHFGICEAARGLSVHSCDRKPLQCLLVGGVERPLPRPHWGDRACGGGSSAEMLRRSGHSNACGGAVSAPSPWRIPLENLPALPGCWSDG